MSTCVLRVSGRNFDVDKFLRRSALPIYRSWHRGDPQFVHKSKGPKQQRSGFNAHVAQGTTLNRQISGAILFIDRHQAELRRLMRFPGVDGAEIDFSVHVRRPNDFMGCYRFGPELTKRVSRLGIDLSISWYLCSD